MCWDDKHPCPNCGKEHEERETLNKCTNCGQVYCGSCSYGCPKCGNMGSTPVTWNSIQGKWC
ncbi:MAG: hypothetical protein IJL14_09535 [Selenomonadaceae bacterium]|nr:hypothetical protein [Selenomonadaceae bacterium]